MLTTPFGTIVVTLDDRPAPCAALPVDRQPVFAGVDGVFLLCYAFENDGTAHRLRCFLDRADAIGGPDSGERLEAVTMDIGQGRLTIGCEADFGATADCDYDGYYLPTGLEIMIRPETKSREFLFGVAWMERCASPDDVQTWYGADPTLTVREREDTAS